MKNSTVKYLFAPFLCLFLVLASAGLSMGADRITAEELKSMIDSNEKVVLIDVRTPQEHNEAHIPGSILMPLDTLEGLTRLPVGDKVIIYCRSGKRSLRAIEILSAKGFTNLTDLEGGITAWIKAGGKVVSSPPK